jgi:probable DNA metabolism protein
MIQYAFDGTYIGFLTCIFESFSRKDQHVILTLENSELSLLFQEEIQIISDKERAERVLKGIKKAAGANIAWDIFQVFLSEDPKAWNASFQIIKQIFIGKTDILNNYGDPDVLYFSQTLKKVSRERHRMKAFVRFSKDNTGVYHALIEPDFNVIPLIIDFFRKRFADQPWLIFDVKRKYGVYYNLKSVEEVKLEEHISKDQTLPVLSIEIDEKDQLYAKLWQSYFKSTNIEARKNLKLHLRHVPKRYWKYLVEKTDN